MVLYEMKYYFKIIKKIYSIKKKVLKRKIFFSIENLNIKYFNNRFLDIN